MIFVGETWPIIIIAGNMVDGIFYFSIVIICYIMLNPANCTLVNFRFLHSIQYLE